MKNKNHAKKLYRRSLFILLVGIFLWPQIAYLSSITPEKITELTNKERQKENLSSLELNDKLSEAALNKANDIIESGTFKHNIDGKKFSEWVKEAGYQYSYTGENLAIDFITSEGVMRAWLNSETHKKNILSPYYEEIGVSVIEDKFNDSDTVIVVQTFGSPMDSVVAGTFKAKNNNQNYYSYNNENLLTHSKSNNLTTSEINNLQSANVQAQIISLEKQSAESKLNSLFQKYNLSNIFKYLSFIASITFIILMLYIYFLSFSYITRLI